MILNVRTRKFTIATLFLLVLALAPVFYSLQFNIRQQNIRRRMKEQLEEKMLHTVLLNTRDIKWVRPGKEIMMNDRMFDVKSIAYNPDGSVTVTGLFDEEETVLVQQLQKQQEDNNTQGNQQLVKLFQQFLTLPEEAREGTDIVVRAGKPLFPDPHAALASTFKDILTPPPQA